MYNTLIFIYLFFFRIVFLMRPKASSTNMPWQLFPRSHLYLPQVQQNIHQKLILVIPTHLWGWLKCFFHYSTMGSLGIRIKYLRPKIRRRIVFQTKAFSSQNSQFQNKKEQSNKINLLVEVKPFNTMPVSIICHLKISKPTKVT